MSVDFSLQRREKGRQGLTMRLVAGPATDDANGRPYVDVDETAFGFLEPAVKEHWPRYKNYGHWGVTPIPEDAWSQVVWSWRELHRKLEVSADYGQAPALNFVPVSARDELGAHFAVVREGIMGLIVELSAWIEVQLQAHSHVTIEGV